MKESVRYKDFEALAPKPLRPWFQFTCVEELWRLVEPEIDEADLASEKAFHFYGGARQWVVENLSMPSSALVLDVGYGQGLFSIELASHVVKGRVVGIDYHTNQVTAGTTRRFGHHANVLERIELIQGEAMKLPFRDASFDFVATFLGAQDIEISRGDEGLFKTIREMCRVTKPGGTISVTDDCFPECKPKDRQGILFDAMRKHWQTLLPPIDDLKRIMEASGVSEFSTLEFEPREWIPPSDAKRELRMAAKWARPQGVDVNFDAFWREVEHIVSEEGRRYAKLVQIIGVKIR